jgi:hypothetical protein
MNFGRDWILKNPTIRVRNLFSLFVLNFARKSYSGTKPDIKKWLMSKTTRPDQCHFVTLGMRLFSLSIIIPFLSAYAPEPGRRDSRPDGYALGIFGCPVCASDHVWCLTTKFAIKRFGGRI